MTNQPLNATNEVSGQVEAEEEYPESTKEALEIFNEIIAEDQPLTFCNTSRIFKPQLSFTHNRELLMLTVNLASTCALKAYAGTTVPGLMPKPESVASNINAAISYIVALNKPRGKRVDEDAPLEYDESVLSKVCILLVEKLYQDVVVPFLAPVRTLDQTISMLKTISRLPKEPLVVITTEEA